MFLNDVNFRFHLLLLVASIPFLPFSSSSIGHGTLAQGSSLSPARKDDLLSSPSGEFTAGFYQVGQNAFYFAVWFTDALADGSFTVVWMANRDEPVNGRYTKLYLSDTGNLILTDAGQFVVWASGTESSTPVQLKLLDSGNLVLISSNDFDGDTDSIWRSFDSPTDTLLPLQYFNKSTRLVSSRSATNYSSGLYRLFFDNDNTIRLLYESVLITSVFWPPPWMTIWEARRTSYNSSRIAFLDSIGFFHASDLFQFNTSDYGIGIQRRVTLDHDGNLRAYGLDKGLKIWKVTWQAIHKPCNIHGVCGVNSLCSYKPKKCSCLSGYKMKNDQDWSEGCVPEFEFPCNNGSHSDKYFLYNHVEFYGYDQGFYRNVTLDECKRLCSIDCSCKGFQYRFDWNAGFYMCLPKFLLFNGYQSIEFEYWFYLKLPESWSSSSGQELSRNHGLQCSGSSETWLEREYVKKKERSWLKYLLWCSAAIGALEITCLLIFLFMTRQSNAAKKGYGKSIGGFRRFTYAELKKATRNFSDKIGEGGSGVVFKGTLEDNRIAAIKSLNESKIGEAEFLAEVSLLGRLNHGNLIESWGYCSEGKRRLLVYEFMENGSLAENLHAGKLNWKKRFDIAVGTAKGLRYLHDECLEWVLHCDVKPENILLDGDYQAKVSDFGLSKIVDRGRMEDLNVSRIRGTRGYMAPEWVSRQPITSKVDVYSYGIVVIEMMTGKKTAYAGSGGGRSESGSWRKQKTVVETVMEVMWECEGGSMSWIERIVDPRLGSEYEVDGLERLIKVGLKCSQENKEDRPVMKEVVDMLVSH